MVIIFENSDFIYNLFPIAKGSKENLKAELKSFYKLGSVEPDIDITDNLISISIDTIKVELEQIKFNKLMSLCESGKFTAAKPIAERLVLNYPSISEYHRILGQISSELGEQNSAINSLIDALKWNPKNEWALLMMGNIFAKFKDDVDTAMKYYNQVLLYKPNDNITLNNIGANLMKLGKIEEAITYFEKALIANPNYPNTHYALALVYEMSGDLQMAFNYSIESIKVNKPKNQLYNNSIKLAIDIAQKIEKSLNSDSKNKIETYIKKLEYETEKKIRVEGNSEIQTAAKVELAENHNKDYHLIKYKPNYPAIKHLILHELTHIELAHEARKKQLNQLFTTNNNQKAKFIKSLDRFVKKIDKKGISNDSISNYLNALFEGINNQVFNTPIDLFIEDRIYENFKEFRPIQFLSLLNMVQEGIEATTRKDIVKKTPQLILSKSKIYNLINALHFKKLFFLDLRNGYKASNLELNQANELYQEFLEYRQDKEPAEEYELLQHWAEDLKLDSYFELIPEDKHKQRTIEKVIADIENDPYDLNTLDLSKERKMKKFLKSHSSENINMAVSMHMVGAIEFFDKLSKENIKEIAFEIATVGMSGIDPKKDGYSIPSIKGSKFSGYKTLAYYYVSWALGLPEMLKSLKMPFDKEYELAKKMNSL